MSYPNLKNEDKTLLKMTSKDDEMKENYRKTKKKTWFLKHFKYLKIDSEIKKINMRVSLKRLYLCFFWKFWLPRLE